MPSQHSAHHPLRHQNQRENLLWTSRSSSSSWPHPSQQVTLLAFFFLEGLASVSPALCWPGQTGLCLVTGLAADVEGGHGKAVTGNSDPLWGAQRGCIAGGTSGAPSVGQSMGLCSDPRPASRSSLSRPPTQA